MIFDISMLFQQIPLTTLVPDWFYLFSGLVYLLAGAVSLFVSYYSFKLSRITSSKSYSLLAVSFLLIGIAFLIISIVSVFTYQDAGDLDNDVFILNTNAYNAYYMLSIIAYLFLVMINLPKKDERLYLFVPLWFISSSQFHIVSLMFLIYISARSVLNFFKVKSEDAFLVMLAFLMITLFHVFLLLIPFGVELFLVAHIFLIAGFISLLTMLIRVTRK
jgi:hypothetical protein